MVALAPSSTRWPSTLIQMVLSPRVPRFHVPVMPIAAELSLLPNCTSSVPLEAVLPLAPTRIDAEGATQASFFQVTLESRTTGECPHAPPREMETYAPREICAAE